MPGPTLILPSAAMPWGRWVENAEAETDRMIQSQEQDANSVGSQFRSRADILQGQISNIQNVATQSTYTFPDFTRSKASGSFDGPNVMLESPIYTFNPPKPNLPYRGLFFCNVNATQTAGTGNLNFINVYMSINGRIFRNSPLEENRTDAPLSINSSIGGWENVSPGEPVSVQFGVLVGNFEARTLQFTNCSATGVYIGAL